jgi:hypothetical protein
MTTADGRCGKTVSHDFSRMSPQMTWPGSSNIDRLPTNKDDIAENSVFTPLFWGWILRPQAEQE